MLLTTESLKVSAAPVLSSIYGEPSSTKLIAFHKLSEPHGHDQTACPTQEHMVLENLLLVVSKCQLSIKFQINELFFASCCLTREKCLPPTIVVVFIFSFNDIKNMRLGFIMVLLCYRQVHHGFVAQKDSFLIFSGKNIASPLREIDCEILFMVIYLSFVANFGCSTIEFAPSICQNGQNCIDIAIVLRAQEENDLVDIFKMHRI